ncbi:ATP-dependent zinc metalloprotease FtsH [Mycoplasmopsis columboralis]|uniref:ATP-dependent zinc metalloprotease FtsH n=1 Tax=Mycoplasmopsis columboralis TaxID=171282 RepID=A0A449B6T7_9BACT|nr:ATP-dependent zinc metalloprotease FtsH [Mycoplasmopsis columboralis]VEU76327.1 AAA ATPase [Mycoplasmopsis columboralis]
MKNTNTKRKIITIALIIVLLAIAIGLIAYYIVSLTSAEVPKTITDLNKYILDAKKDTSDNIYFESLTTNPFTNSITGVFVEEGKKTSFITYGNLRDLEALKGSVNATLPTEIFQVGEVLKGSYSSVATPKQNVFVQILISMIPWVLILIVSFFIFRSLNRSMSGQSSAFGGDKSPAQLIKSDKKFSDIAGNKEPIEEIKEIVDYLKNPKKYEEAGARMPRGILLGGPPGTGKTLLAKATAGEASVPFYFVSASNFVELFVGMGAKRVRQVIAEARKNSPAIIFIDELDAIGRTRGSGIGGGHDEREQTLNQLLVEMDGIKENSGLLFVAATNRTDILDPALTRPGRFDRIITVGLPDVKEREEILKLHAKGKRFDSSINFEKLARRTPGFSGAQLENVINEAVLLSVRENTNVISVELIDEAIDRVMSGPAKKSRTITKEELTLVAYHEAGHAVVGLKMPGGNKVQKITIIPRGNAGGYNLMMPENEKYNYTKQELLASIASFMGGRVAEEIKYGSKNITTGASDDIKKATSIARRMVVEFGMSDLGPIKYHDEEGNPFLGKTLANGGGISNQVSHEIDLEVRKIIFEAKNIATKIINENLELLELIKTLLLEQETIIAEEIEYIAKNLALPPKKSEQEKSNQNNIELDDLIELVGNEENKEASNK